MQSTLRLPVTTGPASWRARVRIAGLRGGSSCPLLRERGIRVVDDGRVDLHLVNTCTVTATADPRLAGGDRAVGPLLDLERPVRGLRPAPAAATEEEANDAP